ncbi:hypothetical protein FUAX_12620 [Fulvitalea axinellae]|uniref:Metal-dependent hydrolase n=1 Tax=Fulvitalea axinellae TaxID=1182444 RepID=A0AAU9DD81_9BACT|nr:hypothetical protein FUAX_12620 [Fulvitalea axinellae]
MDILTHTMTGLAVGTVAAGFSKKSWFMKSKYILAGGFAGALPDVDTVSLWSKFDKYFGPFFQLENSGKHIYSAKFWYSHHGFMHSLLAPIVLLCILALIVAVIKIKIPTIKQIRKTISLLTVFVLGYWAHLLEDMPTPSASWGGVNFFWPSVEYTGGWGKIWWWNNYDVFIFISAIVVFNLLILALSSIMKFKAGRLCLSIFVLGVTLSVWQITNRAYDFNVASKKHGYAFCEKKSKEIQREVLGKRIYTWMVALDNKIKLNF